VALDGSRVPLTLAVVHRVPAHGGGHLGITEDLSFHCVETGNGPCPCGDISHGVRFIILVEDPGGIPFPGLLHRGHLPAGGLIRSAAERIGGQDGLHDSVERSHIGDRGSECPDGRLDIGLLDEISHADTPVYGFPGISDRREYIKKKGVYGRDCIIAIFFREDD